jgi:hypothetical protein
MIELLDSLNVRVALKPGWLVIRKSSGHAIIKAIAMPGVKQALYVVELM